MDLADFRATLDEPAPPARLAPPLRALWHDARGHWQAAHALVQDDASDAAAHVHAYLHRKEGDLGNAHYWYRRAAQPPAAGSLDDEWRQIAARLLAAQG